MVAKRTIENARRNHLKPSSKKSKQKIVGVSMVRNEADIIHATLNHAIALFDRFMIVDIQSTDGTLEIIKSFKKVSPVIELYHCHVQERYQSAMLTVLAKRAFENGADWVFPLDADEFLNVTSRLDLEELLDGFSDTVLHLPWINLVPTEYGEFSEFDVEQNFFWSGRSSQFSKVAISSAYANENPEFKILEGSHNVVAAANGEHAKISVGLSLLHLPIRSGHRLNYKLVNALRLLRSKHNSSYGEGSHVGKILLQLKNGTMSPKELNAIAANYGTNEEGSKLLSPKAYGWPQIKLPRFVIDTKAADVTIRSQSETLVADLRLSWKKLGFVGGTPVMSEIIGNEIVLLPEVMAADGRPLGTRFASLARTNPGLPQKLDMDLLMDAVSASFAKIQIHTFSAWTKLIPVMFCLFSILRPRRFVELGVHNGMSFFAGCQATEFLGLETQCVAVDSWIGDPHASFHSDAVFADFSKNIRDHFPKQQYIRSYFSEAARCFDDDAIDLLHIDGYHTYDAVKQDFETWLPKMSQTGVMIFHDINVYERGFGVWRLWGEIEKKYPTFSFAHGHGLGIAYVGSQPNSILELLRLLKGKAALANLAQHYFQLMGDQSSELGEYVEKAKHSQSQGQARSIPEKVLDVVFQKHKDNIQKSEPFPEPKSEAPFRKIYGFLYGDWKDKRIIENSGLFDSNFYLTTYGDVRNAKVDPLWHFVRFGAREFRNPNSSFETRNYWLEHQKELRGNENPFAHFILSTRKGE